jgi:hypothetical protein
LSVSVNSIKKGKMQGREGVKKEGKGKREGKGRRKREREKRSGGGVGEGRVRGKEERKEGKPLTTLLCQTQPFGEIL